MDDTPLFGHNDFVFTLDGNGLRTHSESRCVGDFCCVHNPSDHPLRHAQLNWRADRYLMERICTHGIGHPDPDDLAYKRRQMSSDEYNNYAFGVHGCDGCCRKS